MAREILKCTGDAIARCASVIRSGGVVVFPTDTVYGMGCDPYNDQAVERIFAIKGRAENKPLPILIHSTEDAEKLASLGHVGIILARKFWPGALTIVAPITDKKISHRVTLGREGVALRVPSNKCVLSLLEYCKYLVGTSANRSGERSFKSAQEVIDSSLHGYDALLDGGSVEKGVESTIIEITGRPKVLREGAIKATEVMDIIGRV
jgi:L-threonylcarbamoyladenylate synthase